MSDRRGAAAYTPPTSGYARVYTGPEPARGAHPGFRGQVAIDASGVHYSEDCEFLSVDNDASDERWPMGDWSYTETSGVVPWHRVDTLEWTEPESEPT